MSNEALQMTAGAPLSHRLSGVGDLILGTKTGAVRLGREIAAGGEGRIFATPDPSVVCKIYHADQLTSARQEKLALMLSRSVRVRGVCWPSELVTTSAGEFVGYFMPAGAGKTLATAIFAKELSLRDFPHWTRDQLDQLAITILETIESLHELNIYIGGLNPRNILVTDEHTISLVGLDSVQVEAFPGPAGKNTFTPARRQGQSFADFLRSADDELFAVTTLLFMILFPGTAPGADGRPPVGVWQFIWSHLRRELQEDFTDVFRLNARIPIKVLIKHLRQEQRDIRDGIGNAEIFPDKPRIREGDTVAVLCAACPPGGNLHPLARTTAARIREKAGPWYCSPCRAMRKITRLENRVPAAIKR